MEGWNEEMNECSGIPQFIFQVAVAANQNTSLANLQVLRLSSGDNT